MAEEKPLLEGIRVVEVATFVAGPAAATILADYGAEVVKIEMPGIGDPQRVLHRMPPLPACEEGYCWTLHGRNKQSIVVDLTKPAGLKIALELVAKADVFVTNYHPSVLAKLGLSYEQIGPANPRLVYAHITGYGERGDEVEKPGYDGTAYWARSGLMDVVRAEGADWALSAAGMGDHPTATALSAAIFLGLFDRERTGKGRKVSTSLLANGTWANGLYVQAAIAGAEPFRHIDRSRPMNAVVNVYATRDGRGIFLGLVLEAKDWPRFCETIGRKDLLADPRFAELSTRRANAPALTAILDEIFAAKDFAEWKEILDRHSITFGTVARTEDLPSDPQAVANGVFLEQEDGTRIVASPIHASGVRKVVPRPAPPLGADTRAVLASLGYGRGEVDALVADGTVVGA